MDGWGEQENALVREFELPSFPAAIDFVDMTTLVNRMRASDECEPWTFGVSALMTNLAKRGVL